MWVKFCIDEWHHKYFHFNLDEMSLFEYYKLFQSKKFEFRLYFKNLAEPILLELSETKAMELISLLNTNLGIDYEQ